MTLLSAGGRRDGALRPGEEDISRRGAGMGVDRGGEARSAMDEFGVCYG